MHQKNQNEENIEEAAKPDDPAEKEVSLRYENRRQVAKGGILGFFIGLAVIVPGVSGSAVAIIFRLYEKLLYALGNLFRKFKACICFLLPIAIGLVAGFVLGFFGVRVVTCRQTPRRCGQALNALALLFFSFSSRPERTN